MDKGKKKNIVSKKINKRKPFLFPRKILPVLAAAAVIVFTSLFLHRIFLKLGYFTLDSAEVVWHDEMGVVSSRGYDELAGIGIGKNTFRLDVKKISKKIISEHPEFKNCIIERSFPGGLVLNIYARQPAVQIDYGKFYLVDKEGILLSKPKEEILEKVPVVTGINWKPSEKVGKKQPSPRLFKALKLVSAVEESGLLEEYSMKRIDVSDHRNLVFFVDGELEIKIGRENFGQRLNLLKETLASSYINKNDLEYIDLRFDDIVFGTRTQ